MQFADPDAAPTFSGAKHRQLFRADLRLREQTDRRILSYRRYLTHAERVESFIKHLNADPQAKRRQFEWVFDAVSYTHLTLPTKA